MYDDVVITPSHPLFRTALELRFKAVEKFGSVRPCYGKSFFECFTAYNGKVQFWFNTLDDNTHVLSASITEGVVAS
jgi:hypothetical protein